MTRERVEIPLLAAVACGTALAVFASMAHMVTVYGWGNNSAMAYVVAGVTVTMNVVYVGLAIITRDRKMKQAVNFGIALLAVVEFLGNMAPAGLIIAQTMPTDVADFFFVSQPVAVRMTAFFVAGFLPILNMISSYCLAHATLRLLAAEPAVNPWAEMAVELSDRKAASPVPGTPGNGKAPR